GKHDGLYWTSRGAEVKSPLGPRLVQATYQVAPGQSSGEPQPYHGYLYRMLTAQGKNAPGGAKDYLVDGMLTQGFAVVAYPARYRSSGVVTFIVNQDGIVFQKDLGPTPRRSRPPSKPTTPTRPGSRPIDADRLESDSSVAVGEARRKTFVRPSAPRI